eukprot:gene11219-2037_t
MSLGSCLAAEAGSAKAQASGNGNGNNGNGNGNGNGNDSGGSRENRKQKKRRFGDVIYMLKEDATEQQRARLQAALERAGLANEREGRGMSQAHTSRRPSQEKAFDFEEKLASDLMSCDGGVAFAEPNYVLEPVADPDPQRPPAPTRAGSPAAWDISRGSGVTIAVLDSGFETSHPDLAGRFGQGVNTADNPFSSRTGPVASHGTLVAGTVAATANNGVGGAGTAYEATILPIRITNEQSGSAF